MSVSHRIDWSAIPAAPAAVPGVTVQSRTGEHVQVKRSRVQVTRDLPARHSHPDQEKCLVILEGRVRLSVGDEELVLTAGDVVLVPPGVEHGALEVYEPMLGLEIFAPHTA